MNAPRITKPVWCSRDWLQERDDPRAEGYRALGMLRRYPHKDVSDSHKHTGVHNQWFFHNEEYRDDGQTLYQAHSESGAGPQNGLPACWLIAASDERYYSRTEPHGNHLWGGYHLERRKVEDFFATAFAELPPGRRAELLAGKVRA